MISFQVDNSHVISNHFLNMFFSFLLILSAARGTRDQDMYV